MFYCYFLQFFKHFMVKIDGKSCLGSKNSFDQLTACGASLRWSKYTTRGSVLFFSICSLLKCTPVFTIVFKDQRLPPFKLVRPSSSPHLGTSSGTSVTYIHQADKPWCPDQARPSILSVRLISTCHFRLFKFCA